MSLRKQHTLDFQSFVISFGGSVSPPVATVDRVRTSIKASIVHAKLILELYLQALPSATTEEELARTGRTHARELASALPILSDQHISSSVVPPSPNKRKAEPDLTAAERHPKRNSFEKQEKRRAVNTINALVKKTVFVQWNSSKPKHQETAKSHRAEILLLL
jgi:hypothetical protein